ncbi:helix-turn-helix domain-containing protein [Streptomyces longispororuber]|uniref:helix-turn-helix domain-containing protein n=1 Tax=Streptomyces longispororuber TaxID=68230 RepID=UPI00210AC4DE|nr:XRE family transcriptional regulator [Streptomyces longispororuber]MCQ4214059.1 XRE family transcriptional regulator [Streptomyces longispororuber]
MTMTEDGKEPGPGSARSALAGNLNRRRLSRGWSLRELSAHTGVSKALLSQIERAEANPTLDVLSRIADVLDTTCTELLRRPLLEPEIVRAADLTEAAEETTVSLLFTGSAAGRSEFYRSRLHPHAQSQVSTHGIDSVEYVLVVSGAVTLVVDDVPHLLGEGDAARFSGLSPHYYATQESPAITHSVVLYPPA